MSFGELAIVVIVGLIVIGPKELPKVLRKLGQWAAKLRRMAADRAVPLARLGVLVHSPLLQVHGSAAVDDLQVDDGVELAGSLVALAARGDAEDLALLVDQGEHLLALARGCGAADLEAGGDELAEGVDGEEDVKESARDEAPGGGRHREGCVGGEGRVGDDDDDHEAQALLHGGQGRVGNAYASELPPDIAL